MFEKEKREILDAALEIKKCNLISLSGGNVSMRAGENLFLVTPTGMIYEEMTADDVVVIDRDCRVVEGTRKPSSDSPALVYMFEHMPHINALIHTHQPYATAAGFASDQIPEFLVTLIDANGAAVNVAPFTPSSDIGMGIMAEVCRGGTGRYFKTSWYYGLWFGYERGVILGNLSGGGG